MDLPFRTIYIGDLPPEMRHDGVTIGDTHIFFTEQKTGFGVKKLFLCPNCGARRAKLVYTKKGFYCHGCAPFNVYRRRCNLYDGGGDALVTYHMQKLAASVGISIQWPFSYLDYLFCKPKSMRWSKWTLTMKRLQRMEGMRNAAIFFRRRYTAQDIKRRTTPAALAGYELEYLRRYWILS